MNPFEVLKQLPQFLAFNIRGVGVHPDLSPALCSIGGQIWLYYIAEGFVVVIAERLNDMEELQDQVDSFLKELDGKTVYDISHNACFPSIHKAALAQKDPHSKDLIFQLQSQLPYLSIIVRGDDSRDYWYWMPDCIPVLVFHKEYLQFNYRDPGTNRHIEIGAKMYNEEDVKREVMYLIELAKTGRHLEVYGSGAMLSKPPWQD